MSEERKRELQGPVRVLQLLLWVRVRVLLLRVLLLRVRVLLRVQVLLLRVQALWLLQGVLLVLQRVLLVLQLCLHLLLQLLLLQLMQLLLQGLLLREGVLMGLWWRERVRLRLGVRLRLLELQDLLGWEVQHRGLRLRLCGHLHLAEENSIGAGVALLAGHHLLL